MRPDNNTLGLFCLTIIVMFALWLRVDGAKELTLTVCGAIGGWLAKEKTA